MAKELTESILEENYRKWKRPDQLYKRAVKRSWFFQDIVGQIKKGFSVVILIVGRPRTGKTWLALTIASLLDPYFIEHPNMYFNIFDFTKDMVAGIKKDYTFPRKVFLIDEVGRDLDYRAYSSIFNKTFNYVLQTQQIVNKIFILVLPHAKLLAKAHHYFLDYVLKTGKRGSFLTYKINTDYADLEGKTIYRQKLERLSGFILPHPKVIDWFKNFEVARKQEIGEDILKLMENKNKKQIELENMEKLLESIDTNIDI